MVFSGGSQSCDRKNLVDTLVACVSSLVLPSDDNAYWTCSYVMKICCMLLALWYQNHTAFWLKL